MYIKSVHIQNIRSISELTLDFGDDEAKMAGWHVLIGENGSGKTTILRLIAMGLMGSGDLLKLGGIFGEKVEDREIHDAIELRIRLSREYDSVVKLSNIEELQMARNENYSKFDLNYDSDLESNVLKFNDRKGGFFISTKGASSKDRSNFQMEKLHAGTIWDGSFNGFFSCGFGSIRKFRGGENGQENSFMANLEAHSLQSLFDENWAFDQLESWLKNLDYEAIKRRKGSLSLKNIRSLLNDHGLLPDGTKLIEIGPEGLTFQDGNSKNVDLHNLSDGYRSILSLTMELIRQLLRVYGEEKVFSTIEAGGSTIDLPGVVLIDEIDAHLHPTWQTQIGQWFTKYFPKLQFIVTTHSPLICRACGDTGRIWHLRAPGSAEEAYEVTGQDRNRLVYGNILDAYGTQAFGSGVMRSEEGSEKFRRLGELNMKSIMGTLQPEERAEYEVLQSIFPSGK